MVLVALFSFFLFFFLFGSTQLIMSLQETSQETRYLKKLKLTTSIPKKSANSSLRRL